MTRSSVIFLLDIDGTLVDSDKHLSNTIKTLYATYGVAFDPQEFFEMKSFMAPDEKGAMKEHTTMLFGATWEMSYYYMMSQRPHTDPGVEAFRKDVVDYVTAHHHTHVVPRRDVIEMILRKRAECMEQGIGFSVVAVTNGARKEALANLALAREAGLEVDALISADDVEHRKPHPEPYHKGASRAREQLRAQGFDTENAVVIALEDSPPGAQSACEAMQDDDGVCFYMPTTNRPLLLPGLTPEQENHFVIEQDIAALETKITALIHGRSDPSQRMRSDKRAAPSA